MYKINIINDLNKQIIHDGVSSGKAPKIKTGSIVQGINTIDSFSFSIYPNNPAFNKLLEYKTEIEVFNTIKKEFEFLGRILKPKDYMDSNGLIYKEVVCESLLGYLCDSKQLYIKERNWKVTELLTHILDCHNSQVEEKKRFHLGKVTVTDKNDNLYVGIQRENSWKTINDKLISVLGGEIKIRRENNILYLDYLTEIGEEKDIPIKLRKNMKSIAKETDPSSFITRIIPLGAKIKEKDSSGNEVDSEQRIGIESVNNGQYYIDDDLAIIKYGIIVGYIYFDDVTDPSNLLAKTKDYIKNNNKILGKFTIAATDLSLIGLTPDSFKIGNYHPVINELINVKERLRIIKKTININEPTSSSLEFGDSTKSLSDLQLNSNNDINKVASMVQKINSDYTSSRDVDTAVSNSIKKEGIVTKNTVYNNSNGVVIANSNNSEISLSNMPSLSSYTGKRIEFLIACDEQNYKFVPFELNSSSFFIDYSYVFDDGSLCNQVISVEINNTTWKFKVLYSSAATNKEVKLYKIESYS